jgi:hypothetical protein
MDMSSQFRKLLSVLIPSLLLLPGDLAAQTYPSPTFQTENLIGAPIWQALTGIAIGNGNTPASAIAPGLGVATALTHAVNTTGGLTTYGTLPLAGGVVQLEGQGAGTGATIFDTVDTDSFLFRPTTAGSPLMFCNGPESAVGCNVEMHGIAAVMDIYTDASSDYLGIGDSSTPGSGPDIFCGGPESSVSCNIQPKGSGNIYMYEFGGASSATLLIGPYVFSGAYPGPIIQSSIAATPLLLAGGSGNGQVVLMSPLAETASVRQTTGSSSTVAAGIGIVILDGVSATYGLTLPAAPLNGQAVELECGSAVTTLTVTPGSGQTLKGTATSCSATIGHKWRYFTANTSWYMLY